MTYRGNARRNHRIHDGSSIRYMGKRGCPVKSHAGELAANRPQSRLCHDIIPISGCTRFACILSSWVQPGLIPVGCDRGRRWPRATARTSGPKLLKNPAMAGRGRPRASSRHAWAELAQLARRNGHEMLGYLLEMAQLEADEIVRCDLAAKLCGAILLPSYKDRHVSASRQPAPRQCRFDSRYARQMRGSGVSARAAGSGDPAAGRKPRRA